MTARVVVAAAAVAIAAAPLVAPTYHALLMLPVMAYGVILLGLNLLFGYTGLVSFGHALFISLGAATDPGTPGEQVIDGYWMGLSKRSLQVA